jgi:Protein of unknown function (DUF2934)
MWFAEQLNSFLNLGECKEYPIMARSKSIPGSKPSRTTAKKEQSATSNPVNAPDVKAVAGETTVQAQRPEATGVSQQAALAPEATGAKEVKNSLEPRKIEIVRNESRKNVLPINLEEEIRRRAYELYQQRGSSSGSEADDWLTAEREVRQRYRQQSA